MVTPSNPLSNLIDRAQDRFVLINVTVTRRELRVHHPGVFKIKMRLCVRHQGIHQIRKLGDRCALQSAQQTHELLMNVVHGVKSEKKGVVPPHYVLVGRRFL